MGKEASKGIYVMLMLLMSSVPLNAQVWDTIPPPLAGKVYSHVRDGQLHFVVVGEESGSDTRPSEPHIFRSANDGVTWTKIDMPPGTAAFRHSIVLDGTDRLYYLNEEALYRTTDDGASWSFLRGAADASSSMTELRIDDAGRLYLMVMSEGVFTSTDHGASWTACALPSGRQLIIPTHLACIGSELFQWWGNVAVTADTLFHSTDHGLTWSPFLTGMVPREVIDGGNGRVIVTRYPVSNGVVPFQMLATRDGGMQWDTLYIGRTISGWADFRIVEQKYVRGSNDLLACMMTDSTATLAVLVSTDGGSSWSSYHDRSMEYSTSLSLNSANELLFYGTRNGLLRYPRVLSGMEQTGFIPLSVNLPPIPTIGQGIIACSEEMGGRVSAFEKDAGTGVWNMIAGPGIRGNYRVRSATPLFFTPPDTVHAVIGGFYRTTDLGNNWSYILPGGTIAHGNTSENSGKWIVDTYDSIYVSENHGMDWTGIPQPSRTIPSDPCAVAEVEGTLVQVASMESTLWRKAGQDSAWISRTLPWRPEELISGKGNMLYVRRRSSGEFSRTSNRGDSWENPNPGYGNAHALLMVGTDALIALDTTRGIAVSLDRGDSWTLQELTGARPRSIAVHDGYLYVGTQKLGILRTQLSGILSVLSSLQPEHQASCQPRSIELRWAATSLPGPFRIRCGRDQAFSSGLLHIDTTTQGTSHLLRDLLPGMTYYWDVSYESGGSSQRSMVSQFSVAPLPTVQITDPQQNAECINAVGDITWSSQPCVEHSDVEFSQDDTFQTVEASMHTDGAVSHTSYALAFGTQYYARARSTSAAGTGAWSPVISFHTIDDIVAAPVQTEPANQSTITVGPPQFIKWEKVDCVKPSEIVVTRTADFSADTVVHLGKQDPYNYIAMSGAQWTNGTYYWKVRAWRDTVPGDWSPTWSFTLDIPVGIAGSAKAESFGILRVYPMPVGETLPRVTVEYAVQGLSPANIIVLDMLGRQRLNIALANMVGNRQSIPLDVSALPSGQYRIVLQSGTNRDSVPLLIVR